MTTFKPVDDLRIYAIPPASTGLKPLWGCRAKAPTVGGASSKAAELIAKGWSNVAIEIPLEKRGDWRPTDEQIATMATLSGYPGGIGAMTPAEISAVFDGRAGSFDRGKATLLLVRLFEAAY